MVAVVWKSVVDVCDLGRSVLTIIFFSNTLCQPGSQLFELELQMYATLVVAF